MELEVEAVAHGGICTGHAPDGRVVFVRHTLPGERVLARVTEERRRYLRADAVAVRRSSPDRVRPPCPYAGPGRCGGCDWQHVDLAAQRRLKAAVVREQLRRLAGLDVPVEVEDVPGAPDGLGWRTRVRYAVRSDGAVGFRRHRSHAVEPIETCPIAHPLVEDLGVATRRWPGTEAVEVAVGAVTGDRSVVVSGPPRAGVPVLDASATILRATPPPQGRPGVEERAAGRAWHVSAGGFWQVHPGAADALVAAVLALVDPRPGEPGLDLYSGVGLFAGALAQRVGAAGSVVAVEGDVAAAADAARNLADLPSVTVLAAGVDRALLDGLASRPAVVVLDPPRSGAGREVVAGIAALAPRAIGYVACDPAALARDVATFGGLGYRLAGLRALDLFPMTAHVECVALLEPAGGP